VPLGRIEKAACKNGLECWMSVEPAAEVGKTLNSRNGSSYPRRQFVMVVAGALFPRSSTTEMAQNAGRCSHLSEPRPAADRSISGRFLSLSGHLLQRNRITPVFGTDVRNSPSV
jgi:hypothetical protein